MCADRPSRERAGGFALLEVLVALAIGSLVVLAARHVYSQLADSAERMLEAAKAADAAANADQFLRNVVGRIEPSRAGRASFAGHETAARFDTWCEVPAGWLERCTITLAVIDGDSGRILAANLDRCEEAGTSRTEECVSPGLNGPPLIGGERVRYARKGELRVLRRGFQSGGLRYLHDASSGGTWLRSWREAISVPLALGVILDGDTLILRIGERG